MQQSRNPVFIPLVAVLVFLLTLVAQGSRGLFESTEGRYGEAAREMLVSGNFMIPRLDGNPHWTKPPLAYWAMASGMQLVGQNAWGVRLGGAVATAVAAAALAAMGMLLWDRQTGALAALIWATGFLPAAGAHTASTDIYLAAAETCAVAGFLYGWLRGARGGFVLMWACFGLAFLTKGPPGLLPLLPICLFAWRGGRLRGLFPLPGILLFTALGLSWYLIVILGNQGLLEYYLQVEVVDRVASDKVHHSDWQSVFTLYLPVMLGALGVWGFVAAWHVLRSSLRERAAAAWHGNSPALFLVLWALVPLAVFCVVKSKLPLYLLPLAAPLALLAARQLRQSCPMRTLCWIAGFSVLLVVGGKYGYAQVRHKNDMRLLSSEVQPVLAGMPGDPLVAAFRQTKLFGLEFYLHCPIYRLSDIPLKSDYPVDVHPMANFLARQRQPLLMLVRTHEVGDMQAAAAGAGWTWHEKAGTRHWSIGVLEPAALEQSSQSGS